MLRDLYMLHNVTLPYVACKPELPQDNKARRRRSSFRTVSCEPPHAVILAVTDAEQGRTTDESLSRRLDFVLKSWTKSPGLCRTTIFFPVGRIEWSARWTFESGVGPNT
jgi:hypothetical protein